MVKIYWNTMLVSPTADLSFEDATLKRPNAHDIPNSIIRPIMMRVLGWYVGEGGLLDEWIGIDG